MVQVSSRLVRYWQNYHILKFGLKLSLSLTSRSFLLVVGFCFPSSIIDEIKMNFCTVYLYRWAILVWFISTGGLFQYGLSLQVDYFSMVYLYKWAFQYGLSLQVGYFSMVYLYRWAFQYGLSLQVGYFSMVYLYRWAISVWFISTGGLIFYCLSLQVGYSAGITPHPTYKAVKTDKTGHAEVVRIIYDPKIIQYEELLHIFWENHDPTQGMRQGIDIGTQYRFVCWHVDVVSFHYALK